MRVELRVRAKQELTEKTSFIPTASYTRTEWGANLCHSKNHFCPPRSIVLWQKERKGGLRENVGVWHNGKGEEKRKRERDKWGRKEEWWRRADIHLYSLFVTFKNAGVGIRNCLSSRWTKGMDKDGKLWLEKEAQREKEMQFLHVNVPVIYFLTNFQSSS